MEFFTLKSCNFLNFYIFIRNKVLNLMNYPEVYNSIIERAKMESRVKSRDFYYEAHHILPKCLGGEGSYYEWKWHPNLVLLTPKEHYICHRLLCEMHPGDGRILRAFTGMLAGAYRKDVISAKTYEQLKRTLSDLGQSEESNIKRSLSLKGRKRIGKPAWNKGKVWTQESNLKRSSTLKGIEKPNLRLAVAMTNPSTGEILKTFKSITEGANYIEREPSNIHRAIKTGGKAGSYSWMYL
jgi:hypothetical protein